MILEQKKSSLKFYILLFCILGIFIGASAASYAETVTEKFEYKNTVGEAVYASVTLNYMTKLNSVTVNVGKVIYRIGEDPSLKKTLYLNLSDAPVFAAKYVVTVEYDRVTPPPSPIIVSLTPASNSTYSVKDTVSITAQGKNCDHMILYIDSIEVSRIDGNSLKYDYQFPTPGIHTISVRGDNTKNSDDYGAQVAYSSTNKINIKGIPTVEFIFPVKNNKFVIGDTITINVTGTNNHHIDVYVNNEFLLTQTGNNLSQKYELQTPGVINLVARGYNSAKPSDPGYLTEISSEVPINVSQPSGSLSIKVTAYNKYGNIVTSLTDSGAVFRSNEAASSSDYFVVETMLSKGIADKVKSLTVLFKEKSVGTKVYTRNDASYGTYYITATTKNGLKKIMTVNVSYAHYARTATTRYKQLGWYILSIDEKDMSSKKIYIEAPSGIISTTGHNTLDKYINSDGDKTKTMHKIIVAGYVQAYTTNKSKEPQNFSLIGYQITDEKTNKKSINSYADWSDGAKDAFKTLSYVILEKELTSTEYTVNQYYLNAVDYYKYMGDLKKCTIINPYTVDGKKLSNPNPITFLKDSSVSFSETLTFPELVDYKLSESIFENIDGTSVTSEQTEKNTRGISLIPIQPKKDIYILYIPSTKPTLTIDKIEIGTNYTARVYYTVRVRFDTPATISFKPYEIYEPRFEKRSLPHVHIEPKYLNFTESDKNVTSNKYEKSDYFVVPLEYMKSTNYYLDIEIKQEFFIGKKTNIGGVIETKRHSETLFSSALSTYNLNSDNLSTANKKFVKDALIPSSIEKEFKKQYDSLIKKGISPKSFNLLEQQELTYQRLGWYNFMENVLTDIKLQFDYIESEKNLPFSIVINPNSDGNKRLKIRPTVIKKGYDDLKDDIIIKIKNSKNVWELLTFNEDYKITKDSNGVISIQLFQKNSKFQTYSAIRNNKVEILIVYKYKIIKLDPKTLKEDYSKQLSPSETKLARQLTLLKVGPGQIPIIKKDIIHVHDRSSLIPTNK